LIAMNKDIEMLIKKFLVIPILLVLLLAAGCQPSSDVADQPGEPAADQDTPLPAVTPSIPITSPSPEQSSTDDGDAEIPDTAAEIATKSFEVIDIVEFPVPPGSHPHDVAPAPVGPVWYTAQRSGELGKLDPDTGLTHHIPLGPGSAPHGVIVGPDHAPWITDSGLNAIVRVDPETEAVQIFPLPANAPRANLNTAVFDKEGILWFTGQNGYYGRLDPATGEMELYEAPGGRGPYGITAAPNGIIYYVSLAGNHLAAVNPASREATIFEPPTPNQGARRVWSDSLGQLWISEWSAGQLARFNPETGEWREWRLPGERPQAYAVYVDERDQVWISDFDANALVHFDPTQETFEVFPMDSSPANIRQILGRPGEIWGAESGVDQLVLLRTQGE
jgi:virginiamycin B lyase